MNHTKPSFGAVRGVGCLKGVALLGILASLAVGSASAEPAAEPAPTPSLHDLPVLHCLPVDTTLHVAADQTVWVDTQPHIPNPDNAARCRKRMEAAGLKVARGGINTTLVSKGTRLVHVDGKQRRWFFRSRNGEQNRVFCWDGETLITHTMKDGYGIQASCLGCPVVPGRVGLYALAVGKKLWATGLRHLESYDGQAWTVTPLPAPTEPDDAHDFFRMNGARRDRGDYTDALFRDGERLWIVRSSWRDCNKPGSLVMRMTAAGGTVCYRSVEQYVTGLVRHGQQSYLLLTDREQEKTEHSYRNVFPPRQIVALSDVPRRRLAEGEIDRHIEELTRPEFGIRRRASEALSCLPAEQAPLIEKAINASTNAEQKHRLQTILNRVRSDRPDATPGTLGGCSAAKLLFVDRTGMQYVQPWSDGQPSDELLLIDPKGGKMVAVSVTSMGSAVGELRLDCEAPDGRVFGVMGYYIVCLDAKHLQLRRVANLGVYAGWPVRLIDVRGDHLWVQLTRRWRALEKTWCMRVSLAGETARPRLPGRVITDGIVDMISGEMKYPIAAGRDGTLWFLKQQPLPPVDRAYLLPRETQIWRAKAGQAEPACDWQPLNNNPSIWPIADGTAIVISNARQHGGESVMILDGETATRYASMKVLVENQATRLLELMGDGDIWTAGSWHDWFWLARMGDGLYMQEEYFLRYSNGGGFYDRSGIYRDGKWVEWAEQKNGARGIKPVINRIAGGDPSMGRVLGWTGGWTTLQWKALSSTAEPDEVLARQSEAWAWHLQDRTHLPYFTHAWFLTDESVPHYKQAEDRRAEQMRRDGADKVDIDVYMPRSSEDFPSWRCWTIGGWQRLDASLYGGSVWSGPLGQTWNVRYGEVEVFYPGGRRQLLEVDAMTPQYSRVVVESDSAVWLTTQQSLWRFVLKGQGEQAAWQADRQFSLAKLGMLITGPWLCGDDMYYTAGERLFHVRLAELLAVEAAKLGE